MAIGLGRAIAETAWLTCENERNDFASIGVTFADRTRLRDFIVQRLGATPMAAAAVPCTGQAQALLEGTHTHGSARTIHSFLIARRSSLSLAGEKLSGLHGPHRSDLERNGGLTQPKRDKN